MPPLTSASILRFFSVCSIGHAMLAAVSLAPYLYLAGPCRSLPEMPHASSRTCCLLIGYSRYAEMLHYLYFFATLCHIPSTFTPMRSCSRCSPLPPPSAGHDFFIAIGFNFFLSKPNSSPPSLLALRRGLMTKAGPAWVITGRHLFPRPAYGKSLISNNARPRPLPT